MTNLLVLPPLTKNVNLGSYVLTSPVLDQQLVGELHRMVLIHCIQNQDKLIQDLLQSILSGYRAERVPGRWNHAEEVDTRKREKNTFIAGIKYRLYFIASSFLLLMLN